jgi:hypothetical protein
MLSPAIAAAQTQTKISALKHNWEVIPRPSDVRIGLMHSLLEWNCSPTREFYLISRNASLE